MSDESPSAADKDTKASPARVSTPDITQGSSNGLARNGESSGRASPANGTAGMTRASVGPRPYRFRNLEDDTSDDEEDEEYGRKVDVQEVKIPDVKEEPLNGLEKMEDDAKVGASVESSDLQASDENGSSSKLHTVVHDDDEHEAERSTGSEGTDEDDDEEEEDDEEPALKYEKVGGMAQDILDKNPGSALAVASNLIVIGTHMGIVHAMDLRGVHIKSYKPHMATIYDISIDSTGDFIGTASVDGRIIIQSLTSTESYAFDLKRPMRTIALSPNFGVRSSSRAFVSGGMAGTLLLHEKGWLGGLGAFGQLGGLGSGHRETVLHKGDGPIWMCRWRGTLIAWATDSGVKIYDTTSQTRIASIDRPPNSPRADLFKCTLHWQDETTLLIAWASSVTVARVRARRPGGFPSPDANSKGFGGHGPGSPYGGQGQGAQLSPLIVEITSTFSMDCMISGIVPHPAGVSSFLWEKKARTRTASGNGSILGADAGNESDDDNTYSRQKHIRDSSHTSQIHPGGLPNTTFLVLSYIVPPETYASLSDEATQDRARQAKKKAERPELRIVSRTGEELGEDVLSLKGYERCGCNDYILAEVPGGYIPSVIVPGIAEGISKPTGIAAEINAAAGGGMGVGDDEAGKCYIVMSPSSIILVRPRDRKDHVEWLVARKRYEEALDVVEGMAKEVVVAREIGQKYMEHLFEEGDYQKAARLCPKVLAQDAKKWEQWVFLFAQNGELEVLIPYIPTEAPRLSRLVYEMILAHYLVHDKPTLLQTIKKWSTSIYDVDAVVVAVQAELQRCAAGSEDGRLLMECLAELFTLNRQPAKALPYFLRLRRPNVFDLIRDHNLFSAVQDQAFLLVEFDQELIKKRKEAGEDVTEENSPAITLLVEHTHSIPVTRVVQQLQGNPYYLYLYLDALFAQDSHLASDFADNQTQLYAEYAPQRLLNFLRASHYYNLEKAYNICKERDYVPEMVFLLGKMGNNKKALALIIERLGDVNRAIYFAREQNDDDLWEDLLRYSESKPAFIRGLLENVGADISPIRLIRRIKNGLEIPGLKDALIKILHDFNLQLSLLDGCQTILNSDSVDLSRKLYKDQTRGFSASASTPCPICSLPILEEPDTAALLFLCRHVVHLRCVRGGDTVEYYSDPGKNRGVSGRIAFASMIRGRIQRGCPVCLKKDEGGRT